MAKKSKAAVKQEIQDLAIGNYKSYPGEYASTDEQAFDNIRSLAKGYWDSRENKEVARDEQLDIRQEDYQQWTIEAHTAFMKAS
ncbi:MAG TPA: hypothetical protein VM802_20350 [Chitinophaga sp.]|uniref:hypothetical protein n=1 Tax=Chitinophaga sp. TaxID=1869181 RepID=UPI002C276EA1|nr:hypothetical protein [Chitinophaga sp.]HVI47240.1 hypothetical protein [Chitinophaga sp.]